MQQNLCSAFFWKIRSSHEWIRIIYCKNSWKVIYIFLWRLSLVMRAGTMAMTQTEAAIKSKEAFHLTTPEESETSEIQCQDNTDLFLQCISNHPQGICSHWPLLIRHFTWSFGVFVRCSRMNTPWPVAKWRMMVSSWQCTCTRHLECDSVLPNMVWSCFLIHPISFYVTFFYSNK